MPVDWSPDGRGVYHALAHSSDSGDESWTALCGAQLAPALGQMIESATPPKPSHRECTELASQTGGLGPRDVQRMVESGAFPPPDDPRWVRVDRDEDGQ